MGQGPDKEGYGYESGNYGVKQDADLKVQGLFPIVVHKGVLFFIGHP